MTTSRLIACLAALCFSLLSVPAAIAQNAFTVTDDARLLSGQLELDNGELVYFKTRSGEMVTVSFEGDPRTYGIVPALDDNDPQSYEVRVLEIEEHPSGAGQMMRQIDLVDGEIGGAEIGLMPSQIATVRIEAISMLETNSQEVSRRDLIQKALETGTNPEQESVCCITCGSTSVCGCAVVMSCGSCCSGGCCGGGGGHGGPIGQY